MTVTRSARERYRDERRHNRRKFAILAVCDLHRKETDDEGDFCVYCDDPWPCDTRKAIYEGSAVGGKGVAERNAWIAAHPTIRGEVEDWD